MAIKAVGVATIGAQVTRQYVGNSVTLSFERQYEYDGDDERRIIYEAIVSNLSVQLDDIEKRMGYRFRDTPPPPAAGGQGGGTVKTTKRVKVTKVFVSGFKDGKKLLKVAGGEYEKWGVPLYDEVAAENGIAELMGDQMIYAPADTWAVVEMNGDKPVKVIAFEGLK